MNHEATRIKAPELRRGHANPAKPTVQMRAQTGVPRPPKGLGTVGRQVWKTLWTAAGPAYLPETDAYAVSRYCELQQRRAELLAEVATTGWTSKGSRGQMMPHPLARMVMDIERMLTPLEDRLGLSPESRMRLGLTQAKVQSLLEDFTAGKDVA